MGGLTAKRVAFDVGGKSSLELDQSDQYDLIIFHPDAGRAQRRRTQPIRRPRSRSSNRVPLFKANARLGEFSCPAPVIKACELVRRENGKETAGYFATQTTATLGIGQSHIPNPKSRHVYTVFTDW
jgi:hypothetical protein